MQLHCHNQLFVSTHANCGSKTTNITAAVICFGVFIVLGLTISHTVGSWVLPVTQAERGDGLILLNSYVAHALTSSLIALSCFYLRSQSKRMSLIWGILLLCVAPLSTTGRLFQRNRLNCPVRVLSSLNSSGSEVITHGPLKNKLSALKQYGLAIVQPVSAPCKGLLRQNASFFLRAHTTDAEVFEQVLDDHEFNALDKLLKGAVGSPRRILDLGANIGLASAYFASRYPEAEIAAVEPNMLNYRMAVLNTKFSNNVTLFFGGIWSKETNLMITKQQVGHEWGFTVKELDDSTAAEDAHQIIPAYTVEGIMHRMGWDSIDILKVDVECTEYELFPHRRSRPTLSWVREVVKHPWLSKIQCMTIEVHDFCDKPKRDIGRALRAAGLQYRGQHGELGMWCNNV